MMTNLEVGKYVLNAQEINVIEVSGKLFLSYDGFRPSSRIESVTTIDAGWQIEYYLGSKKFSGELTKREAA